MWHIFDQGVLKCVRERPVTYVMKQYCHQYGLLLCRSYLYSFRPESMDSLAGQVHGTQAVLETAVYGARVNIV